MKLIYDAALREEARTLKRAGATHKVIGEKLGIKRGSVNNVLTVDLLPDAVKRSRGPRH